LVPLRQACSVDTVDIDEVKRRLRDLARGIAVGGPVGGQALAPSVDFPQATTFAFGSLKDECTVCCQSCYRGCSCRPLPCCNVSAHSCRSSSLLPLCLLLAVDVLEDAVQTICNHLFCRDCVLALCET